MQIKNKFYVTDYKLTTPTLNRNMPLKIMVASDIHYQPHVSRELFTQLVEYAMVLKPDFIAMPGDQIETIDFLDCIDDKLFFESIIRALSEIAPLIIIPGNHEIGEATKTNFFKSSTNDNRRKSNIKALKYFEGLNRIKNVYFLNNEQIKINGVTFLGFNPKIESYLKLNSRKVEEEFISDYLKSDLKMSESDYNVLLTHSPIQIIKSSVFNSIDDFKKLTDLLITGHLHDAYLPKFLDSSLGDTDIGLFFTPFIAPYPGIPCRGLYDFGRGYLLISQGYRKWTADISLFNFFEKFTANDVEKLVISNAKEKSNHVSEEKPFVKKIR